MNIWNGIVTGLTHMVAVLKTEYFVDAKTICTEQPMNRVVAFSFVVGAYSKSNMIFRRIQWDLTIKATNGTGQK